MTTEFPLITYIDLESALSSGKEKTTDHHANPNFLAARLLFYGVVKNDVKENLMIREND